MSFQKVIFLFSVSLMLMDQAWAIDDDIDPCLGSGNGQPCLVTGNGFGYATVSPQDGALLSFSTHPYSMARPDKNDPDSDGVETNNFIARAAWKVKGTSVTGSPSYLTESQVITNNSSGLHQQFFMPFGLKRNALIATMQPSSSVQQPCLSVEWENLPTSQQTQTIGGVRVQVLHFEDVKQTLVAVPLSPQSTSSDDKGSCPFSGSGWAFVSVNKESDIAKAVEDLQRWQKGDSPESLASREVRELDNWRGNPSVCFTSEAARKIYRQSETVLRMAQIQEPNDATHHADGMINASLPTGEFVVPFARDMAYASVALVQTGHQEEAKQAVTAYYNAGPVGLNQKDVHGPYGISTARYFGNGAEDADFSKQPRRNLELDSWGLALWATGSYFNKYHDISWLTSSTRSGTVYQSARDNVVKPLLNNLDAYKGGLIVAKDTSCWEQNDEVRRHYAYSTITAIAGLKQFLPMAEATGDTATVNLVKQKLALLQKGFNAAYVESGRLKGSLERSPKNDMDGAVLEAINMGVVTDPKLIKNTLNRMTILRAKSGGYLRVNNPDGNDEYEKHEFLFINYALARAYLKVGQLKQADDIVNRMQDKALATNNLIPEMYVSVKNHVYKGPVGGPAGAVPMVGYGAGVNNLYLAERTAAAPDVPVRTASADSMTAPVTRSVCPPVGDNPNAKAGAAKSTR